MYILTDHSILDEKNWRERLEMMGDEINACDITENGVYGDRSYGVIDQETGKLANAKNPVAQHVLSSRNTIRPVNLDEKIPPVQITLPTGEIVRSDDEHVNEWLSESFARAVKLHTASDHNVQFEGYVPKEIEELPDRGTVFTRQSPTETFFDIAMIHFITTNTIDALRKLTPTSRIEARRFRPNMMIDVPELEGFVEQTWVGKSVRIWDEVRLKIIQPTKRCVMTTLAQGDLPSDLNVWKTIVKENEGYVGVYAEIERTGKIHVGDEMIVEWHKTGRFQCKPAVLLIKNN